MSSFAKVNEVYVEGTRKQAWRFTCNNPTLAHRSAIQSLKWTFLHYGLENAPTTGTPHLQGYIHLTDAQSRSSICKKCPGFDFRTCNGSAESNVEYCSKGNQPKEEYEELGRKGPNYGLVDGKPVEIFSEGRMPLSAKAKSVSALEEKKQKSLKRIRDAREMDEEEFENEYPDFVTFHHNSLENLRSTGKVKLEGLQGPLVNLWLHGRARCGKGEYVKTRYPDHYKQSAAKPYWTRYRGQSVVWIDEASPEMAYSPAAMKDMFDRDPFDCPVKFKGHPIRPTLVIATSNYSIKETFRKVVDQKAMHGRVIEVNFDRWPSVSDRGVDPLLVDEYIAKKTAELNAPWKPDPNFVPYTSDNEDNVDDEFM